MAGFLPLPGCAIYCTTKFAVRGLSECLQLDLAPHGIGVSVLCPGAVNTNIHEAVLTRPKHLSNTGYYGADPNVMKSLKEVISPGYDPVDLGEIVVRAVQANQLYVIPYAEFRGRCRSASIWHCGDPRSQGRPRHGRARGGHDQAPRGARGGGGAEGEQPNGHRMLRKADGPSGPTPHRKRGIAMSSASADPRHLWSVLVL